MKVAMIVSEMEPFAKTGGLADVAGALPRALGKLGIEVHALLPRYSCVKEKGARISAGPGVTVHFIEHEGYFNRRALYGESNGDYPDNLERFSFFCRQALERLKSDGIRPDLVHAHDWQAALSVVYLSTQLKADPFFAKARSVFTIHNLAYQGLFPKDQYPRLGLGQELFNINGLEFYDQVNLLKGGLVFAGAITTVSPAYAQEIQTEEQGERLEGVLRMRSKDLVGILNGIDQEIWNPAGDSHLPHRYDHRDLRGKGKNKAALQKEVGLPVDPKAFLIGMVSRLAAQKGLDLVVQALPRLAKLGAQLVVLGSGDRAIEESLTRASSQFPTIRLRVAFDSALAHRIYAGADAFLMPSRYEPCGLGQMIAMRYGTPAIVRSTGGLADTVAEDPSGGNGFCFQSIDAGAMVEAVERALRAWRRPAQWGKLRERGMRSDFSWDRSAKEYLGLYERLVG
ncbi:MAG: glycogen synthase GlgA [Candidatus Omnitrophica bacterium]|nr:glycogen synthase GlgA [Candidatus Omnitrophota bacterium]